MIRDNQLIFLSCNHFPACLYRVEKRIKGYVSLQFMERGSIELSYGKEKSKWDQPVFWTGSPGPIYFASANGQPWNHRFVCFNGPLAQQWQREGLLFRGAFACPAPKVGHFAQVFDEFIFHQRDTSRWAKRKAINALEALLIQIAELRQPSPSPQSFLSRVEVLLADTRHFANDYNEIAQKMQISETTLRRRFYQLVGVSIHQFVLKKRVNRVQDLLLNTTLSLQEISDQMGYCDIYYFNRQFTKFTRVPPAVYRSMMLGLGERRKDGARIGTKKK
jgi:AraC-like DNA-binding protein